MILKCKDPKAAFLIGTPSYKILNQSTLPTVFSIWPKEFYTYNKQDGVLRLVDGRIVYLRSSTDPNAAEGIQRVAAAWLDEGGQCSSLFWYNLQARTSYMQAPLLVTSTPYALNWLKRDIVDQANREDRKDIFYRRWASIENPSFPLEEYERMKQILPPAIFKRKYEGIHERMEGLVYSVISDEHYMEVIELPHETVYYAGVDWGYSHAFGIVVRGITPSGFRYEVEELKESGLDPMQKIKVTRQIKEKYNVKMFYCGADRPEMIQLFNKEGIPAIGYYQDNDTRYREVVPGIEAHIELINSGRYRIFKSRCKHLQDEYETYHWNPLPEDNDLAKPRKEAPIAINDDLMSCVRHLTVGTLHVGKIRDITRPKLLSSPKTPFYDTFALKGKPKKKDWASY